MLGFISSHHNPGDQPFQLYVVLLTLKSNETFVISSCRQVLRDVFYLQKSLPENYHSILHVSGTRAAAASLLMQMPDHITVWQLCQSKMLCI